MTTGIRDKVAILGMGCTQFGERWNMGAEDLMIEAFQEAILDAGIDKSEIKGVWLGTFQVELHSGKGGLEASMALRLPNISVTRTENFCATGAEAFRGAVYAVAAGACDIAMAIGVEKLKDSGYGGLLELSAGFGRETALWFPNVSAPGCFSMLASAYATKYGMPMADLKRAMAHVSVRSHANGTLNPKAHLRRPVTEDQVLKAPLVAYPLGLLDCCGVSDGAACAIVTTPKIAEDLGKKDIVTVKSLQSSLSNGTEMAYSEWSGADVLTSEKAAAAAYKEAGIRDPRKELSMAEVHDCFSITELVTLEDLHLSERGKAPKDIMDGFYDLDGKIPCQPDGGLKSFGHPVGATGLRMIYEMYLQLQGKAGERQIDNPKIGLTHNLGGFPMMNVCSVTIVGKYD